MKKKKNPSFWYSITKATNPTEKEWKKNINKISLFIGIAIAVSFVVFIVIALIGGIGKVFTIILNSNLAIYLLSFFFVFIGFLIRFIKWDYYLKELKIIVPFKKNFITYMSLYSMNITPGKIGRILVAYTLNRVTKTKLTSTLPIVTFDIFTDFIGIAIVALATAIYFHTYVLYMLIINAALLIPYLFILNSWFYRLLKSKMGKSRFFLRFSLYGDEYFASQSKLNNPKTYLVSLATSVPAAVFNALALFFVLIAIGINPLLLPSIFIQTSSQVLGMVSASPGNIGVTDGALVALLGSMMKLSVSKSSAVTIMSRLATLWFGVGLGGIFLMYSMKYWKPNTKKKKKKRRIRMLHLHL